MPTKSEINSLVPTTDKNIPTFDLTKLNLLQLCQELEKNLQKPSSSFIWLRNRQNEKLRLERNKIDLILNSIRDLTLTQKELMQFQSETFLSNETLSAIIANKREVIKEQLELTKKKLLIEHAQYDDDLLKIDDDKKIRQQKVRAAELANLRTQGEINQLEASTTESKARADFIMFILNNIDVEKLQKMPDTLWTYLISSIANPHGTQYQDFDIQQQLKPFLLKDADAKSRQSLAIASQTEHQTRVVEKTADKSVFDLDTIRNSTKRD